MQRAAPLMIAVTTGFVMILAYFVPAMNDWGDMATNWFNILAAAALVLGGGNLLKMNLQQIAARSAGWGYAAVMLVSFLATVGLGLAKVGVHPPVNFPDAPWAGDYIQEGSALGWIYEYLINPVTATMFSMLAFFVASAAFRAFRAKNLEAGLLLGTAVIVLLGRTYAGVFLTGWLPESLGWLRFNRLTELIMDVCTTPGTRAITIGIALGVVASSLKILLGMDRPYLGSDEA